MYFGRKLSVVQRNVLLLSCKTARFTTTIAQISNITLVIYYFDILVTGGIKLWLQVDK